MKTTNYDDYLHLKFSLERIFGTAAWSELKDFSTLKQWKKWIAKSLKALAICANETVTVADDNWRKEYHDLISSALERVNTSNTIESLMSGFSGDLLQLAFLQLGLIPNRGDQNIVTLKPDNWKFDVYRSIQYVQTTKQKERVIMSQLRAELGSREANDLYRKFKLSKHTSLAEWCECELRKE